MSRVLCPEEYKPLNKVLTFLKKEVKQPVVDYSLHTTRIAVITTVLQVVLIC